MCLRINSCCGFKNTKDGSLACAFYTGIVSITGVISNSVVLGLFDKYKKKLYDFNKGKLDYDGIKIYLMISLSSAILFFLISLLLFIAVKKEKRLLMIPWLIWMVMLISVQLSMVVILFFVIKASPIILLQCFIIIVFSALNIYCFVCVYSQYRTLQERELSRRSLKL